jgi:hypothetical protein
MSKIIQQIYLGDGHSLYIIDFDSQRQELTFRTSRNPPHLQKEKIQQNAENIHTNLYVFHKNYLNKFISENQ